MAVLDSYYEYEEDGLYCYPGTYVLKNKLDIRDEAALRTAERRMAAIRGLQMDEDSLFLESSFDSAHLRDIHRFLFSDVYEWAGEYRSVNISKGSTFCMYPFIAEQLDELFAKLHRERLLGGLNKDELIVRLAYYLGELNAIHPFREGNGRAQRAFIRRLAYRNGYLLSFADSSNEEMVEASVESFNGDNAKLEALIEKCITPIS